MLDTASGAESVDTGRLVSSLSARLKAWRNDKSGPAVAQRFASLTYLFRIGNAGIAFLTQILLARWMGAFEFGIYIYVWTWVLLLGTVTSLGLGTTPQRFIPQYTEKGTLDQLRGYIAGSRWLAFLISTLFALAGIGGLALFGHHLDSWLLVPLYLGLACLPLYVLTEVESSIARAYDWVGLAMAPTYFVRPILLIVFLAGFHLAGRESNAVDAMLAAILSTFLTALWVSTVIHIRLRKKIPKGPRRYEPRKWLAISLPVFLVDGFYLLLTYTDVLVLERYVPPDQVAVYFAATKLVALVAFVYFAVAAASAHRFTELYITGKRAELEAFVRRSVRWTFIPSVFVGLAVLALGKPILWLFGPEFPAGYALLPVLMIGLLARASIGPAERLLNMTGHQGTCATVYATAFIVNLTLNLALIPYLGLMGAAIATTTAVLMESILLLVITKRQLGIQMFYFSKPMPERS